MIKVGDEVFIELGDTSYRDAALIKATINHFPQDTGDCFHVTAHYQTHDEDMIINPVSSAFIAIHKKVEAQEVVK